MRCRACVAARVFGSMVATIVLMVSVVACGRNLRPLVTEAIAAQIAAARPASASVSTWEDVAAFYNARAHAPVWIARDAPSRSAREALGVLALAPDHGLDANRYGLEALSEQYARFDDDARDASPDQRAAALAEFDVALTRALLALGRDVALATAAQGNTAGPGRTPPDFPASLAAALDDGRLGDWLAQVQPRHAGYAALHRALADFRLAHAEQSWPTVEAPRLERGDEGTAVAALRQRLIVSGDLEPQAEGGRPAASGAEAVVAAYDERVERAVMAFQARHGLAADGVAGPDTIAAMNVSIDERLRQIGQNLARWRALPDDLGDPHVLVNVPAFELAVRERGRDVLTMRVIVGAPGTKTPLFSDTMETIVFSPYWHIPESIAVGETAPEAASDPDYLRRQRIEIVRRSAGGAAEPVDPDDVDWEDPEAVSELALRQRPGPGNALGRVKFLFPNRYAVYLHDTSARTLFERPFRALSHGCVRVAEPAALAGFVLGTAPDWTAERIDQAMHAGEERHVALDRHVPVHLTYFTAAAGDDGRPVFYQDIYRYDR